MNANSWLKIAKSKVNTLDAEVILCEVLGGVDRSFLVAHSERELTGEESARADEMLARRVKGEPLAYILGYKEFYGRRFKVTPDTLIPRPETEVAVDLIRKIVGANPRALINWQVFDIGTGSGCVACSVKAEMPEVEIIGSDISPEALRIARENAEITGVEVDFVGADLLKGLRADFARPTVIYANLPYVDEGWEWVKKENLRFEPEGAIYAGNGGLELIFRLITEVEAGISNEASAESSSEKEREFWLILEADPCQHEEIKKFAGEHGLEFSRAVGYQLVFRGF